MNADEFKVQVPEVMTATLNKGLVAHNLSKKDRELLGELSVAAFGTKSRWQKIVGKQKLIGRTADSNGKVVNQYGSTSVDDVVEYMRKVILLRSLPEESAKLMTNLSVECFSNQNAWQNIYLGDPRPVEQSAEVFKELSEGMLKTAAIREFSMASEEDRVEFISDFFNDKEDSEMVKLVPFVLSTKDEAATKEKLLSLPLALQDKIRPYIVTEFKETESIGVDADVIIAQLAPATLETAPNE